MGQHRDRIITINPCVLWHNRISSALFFIPIFSQGTHTRFVLMVLALSDRSFAISFTVFPEANHEHNLIFTIWKGFHGAASQNSSSTWNARLSARAALMYLRPWETFRMASINSSGALSFVKYPDAPAFNARTAYCSSGYILSTRTGSFGLSIFNVLQGINSAPAGHG